MRPDCAALPSSWSPSLCSPSTPRPVGWAKLCEVARVATPDSEAFWTEAWQNHSYQEIERLVAHARDPQNRSNQNERRIQASADAMARLERARQSLSQEAGCILSRAKPWCIWPPNTSQEDPSTPPPS